MASDQFAHGQPEKDGVAQIALGQVAQIVDVLQGKGFVQPIIGGNLLMVSESTDMLALLFD